MHTNQTVTSAGSASAATAPGAASVVTAHDAPEHSVAHDSGPVLEAKDVTLGYEARTIADHLNIEIPAGRFTVILGPNACGKSTLLRALARLLTPSSGEVLLDGASIRSLPPKALARRLGLLPQSSSAPFGITVADLVGRGRFPHQRMLQQWSAADEEAVRRALAATGTTDLAERAVEELSGGQRQRVWIAMLLAQDTPVMLLDEPTTFLDIAHQLEVLELCRRLNREEGRTLVLVLHDLNLAARFADHLIVMKDGALAACGAPPDVLTEEIVEEVYGLTARVLPDPVFGTPLVIPIASTADVRSSADLNADAQTAADADTDADGSPANGAPENPTPVNGDVRA